MAATIPGTRPYHRVYWVDAASGEVVGGFVGEVTGQCVVVSPDRHDPEAARLVILKADLV